jgi:hypothetical protein
MFERFGGCQLHLRARVTCIDANPLAPAHLMQISDVQSMRPLVALPNDPRNLISTPVRTQGWDGLLQPWKVAAAAIERPTARP